VTAGVTSNSTTWFAVTAPWVARPGPSIAGRVLYVVDSDQALLLILWTVPPELLAALLPALTVRRSRARATPEGPMPLTVKRRNACWTGDRPTLSTLDEPKLLPADLESTYVSATGKKVSVGGNVVVVVDVVDVVLLVVVVDG
jgi:hypothetical protein